MTDTKSASWWLLMIWATSAYQWITEFDLLLDLMVCMVRRRMAAGVSHGPIVASGGWEKETPNSIEAHNMRIAFCGIVVLFLLSASRALAEDQSTPERRAIEEAYQAAITNLVSGSGTGTYEIHAARAGKDSKMELMVKADAKVFFDHNKFHIRLDYEKDDINHLDSRIIVYDGTAILVNRMSKRIQPAQSEADVYEADPTLPTMRDTSFDYNPCRLPAQILDIDSFAGNLSSLTITPDANMDYSGTLAYTGLPDMRASFLASHNAGYNIINYREFLKDNSDSQYVNRRATWERKKNIWYVASIEYQLVSLDGSSERSAFRYTTFDPNSDVSPSLFKFDALSLPPNARVIDRRPTADERVLRQSQPIKDDEAKLASLADSVKSFASKSEPPPQRMVWKYVLLGVGGLVCALALVLIWKRRRGVGSKSEA